MNKHKTYAFICLASLLLFFQAPVLFIADVFISFHIEEVENYCDLGEQDNSNRSANPLEEETIHPPLTVDRCVNLPLELRIENGLYSFKIKTSYQENTTPPPEHA